MKRLFSALFALMTVLSMISCSASGDGGQDMQAPETGGIKTGGVSDLLSSSETKDWVVGIMSVNFDDTHLANVRGVMIKLCELEGMECIVADGKNDLQTSLDHLESFISQKVDVAAVTGLSRESFADVIEMFGEADIPVIFCGGVSPDDSEMKGYKHVYFAGSAVEESGIIHAEQSVVYWNANKEKADKNQDGKFGYVMMTGPSGGYGAEMWTIDTATREGLDMLLVAQENGEWNVQTAYEKMTAVIDDFQDEIEVVFCSNDDMAIGCINALKNAGFFDGTDEKYIPVFGVDVTGAGIEEIRNGIMLASTLNDPVAVGYAVIAIAKSLRDFGSEKTITGAQMNSAFARMSEFGIDIDPDFNRVWTHYKLITAANCDDISFEP